MFLKRLFLTLVFFAELSFISYGQSSLDEEPAQNLNKWNPEIKNGDFIFQPKKLKSTISPSSDAYLLAENTSLKNPLGFEAFKVSFELKLNHEAENELLFNGNTKVLLNASENTFGTIINNADKHIPTIPLKRADGIWQKIELSVAQVPNQGNLLLIENLNINAVPVFQNLLIQKSKTTENNLIFNHLKGLSAIRNLKFIGQKNIRPIELKNIYAEVFTNYNSEKLSTEGYKPEVARKVEKLNYDLGQANQKNNLFVKSTGDLEVETEGVYNIVIDYNGRINFILDGQELDGGWTNFNERQRKVFKLNLSKGTHKAEILYAKAWWRPAFGVFVSGNGIKEYPLHDLSSLPEKVFAGEISLNPVDKNELVRGFFMHQNKKVTTTMAVGSPSKVHYVIDLEKGSVLNAWKGKFLNLVEMWYERGEPQIFQTEGFGVETNGNSLLTDQNGKELPLSYKYYELDAKNNPTYGFSADGKNISLQINTTADRLNFTVNADANAGQYIKLASGKLVKEIEKNLYMVDNYYIQTAENKGIKIISADNYSTLLLPLKTTLTYALIF
jgi:hypothetical protein